MSTEVMYRRMVEAARQQVFDRLTTEGHPMCHVLEGKNTTSVRRIVGKMSSVVLAVGDGSHQEFRRTTDQLDHTSDSQLAEELYAHFLGIYGLP